MLRGGIWYDEDGVWRSWFGSKRYNRCGGKTYRHIRTTQERRANGDCDGKRQWIVEGYLVRGRRRDLPNYWDEAMRDYSSTKSWKHNRRQRWKNRRGGGTR